LELQVALGTALAATKGWPAVEVKETLTRARVLAERLDRQEHLVPMLIGQFWFHFMRAEHSTALPLAEELENIGVSLGEAKTELIGRLQRGIIHYILGDFVVARALLEQCMDLVNPAYHSYPGMPGNHYTLMLVYLGQTLACLGYVDQARSRLLRAISEARRSGSIYPIVHACCCQTWTDWITGSPMAHVKEVVAHSTEHNFPFFLGWALAFRGCSLIMQREAEEGLAVLKQGLAELCPTNAVVLMPVLYTWFAQAYALLGQSVEEQNCIAEAANFVKATGERVYEAELLYRVPGDLLVAAGDLSAAEPHYRQAIFVAEQQSAKLFQLRASTSLARLWRDQGKRAEARDLLGPIYNWFTEGFDAPDQKDAKALLDELA
jgi:predicted ATPase